ncbi:hypothetical protein ACFX1R_011153 [Malus domestica]
MTREASLGKHFFGDEERFCMSALPWKAKVDNYRKFFDTCRDADAAKKDWRLFDNWDRRLDKLPVISAKLSLRVMDADAAKKDWRLFDNWDRRLDKLPVIFCKAKLACDGCRRVWKSKMLLRFLSLPLRFLNWPLRIMSLTLRFFEFASSNSELASSISEISLSADFYRGAQFVSKHT